MIPIARPDLGSEEIAAVTEVLSSGMVAQGRKVAELEGLWADFVGVRHAIAVGNLLPARVRTVLSSCEIPSSA